ANCLKAAAARKEIREAIALLEGLPKLGPRGGRTSERWSLLGSCNKRLAQVTSGKQRIKALETMRECYKQAFDRQAESGTFDSYSVLNRLAADNLLKLLGAAPKQDGQDVRPFEWLRRAENESRDRDEADPSFWNGVPLADVALGRALVQGQLDANVQQEIIAAYLKPWRRGASALPFASVLEQIEFLIIVL